MNRQKIAAGNWKMNTTLEEGRILAEALAGCPVPGGAEVVLCPPFLHLVPVADILRHGSHTVEVIGPVLEAEARVPHQGYWRTLA